MTYKEGKTSSKSTEWYTPPELVRSIETFMGGQIDLDPCADPGHSVPALRHYTQEDNGLALPWYGDVYMNPPYGRNVIDKWVAKALTEQVDEIVMLLPASTDTRWFQPLFDDCSLCFIAGRLKFSGCKDAAFFPSVLAYRGQRHSYFSKHFAYLGKIGSYHHG
jgi:phage N-6-adenine-methyltransferase